jgi:hypothetical protein
MFEACPRIHLRLQARAADEFTAANFWFEVYNDRVNEISIRIKE